MKQSIFATLFAVACSGTSVRYVEVAGDAGTEIIHCSSNSDCPEGKCDETGYCVRTEVVERVCTDSAACDDGDDVTSDECVDGVCHHTSPPVEHCPIAVVRSSGLPDGFEELPMVAGTIRRVIGQVLVLTSCEDVDITQVILHDLVGVDGDTSADFFANLLVSGSFEPFGFLDPIENLTDVPGTVYVFTPAEPIRVGSDDILLLQHQVDVLQRLSGDLSSVNGTAPFAVEVVAVGRETGTIYHPIGDDLQTVWITQNGTLRVQLDPTSPAPAQLVMGTPDTQLMCVSFVAEQEDARVCGLRFEIEHEDAPRILTNLRLRDRATGEQVGGTLFSPGSDGSVVFSDDECPLHFGVPWGMPSTLCLSADIVPWLFGGISGANFRIIVHHDTPDVPSRSVIAEGLVSGHRIEGAYLTYGSGAEDVDIASSYFTTYRTSLSVALAPLSPSGNRSPTLNQVVAIFRVSNTTNVDNLDAMVVRLNVDFGTTLQIRPGATPMIRIYKDTTSPANLLASGLFHPEDGRTMWSDTEVQDFTVVAGGYRDIIVTVDTDGLTGAPGSMRSLTVYMVSSDAIRWNDGVSGIENTKGIPLPGNTLLYSF